MVRAELDVGGMFPLGSGSVFFCCVLLLFVLFR